MHARVRRPSGQAVVSRQQSVGLKAPSGSLSQYKMTDAHLAIQLWQRIRAKLGGMKQECRCRQRNKLVQGMMLCMVLCAAGRHAIRSGVNIALNSVHVLFQCLAQSSLEVLRRRYEGRRTWSRFKAGHCDFDPVTFGQSSVLHQGGLQEGLKIHVSSL